LIVKLVLPWFVLWCRKNRSFVMAWKHYKKHYLLFAILLPRSLSFVFISPYFSIRTAFCNLDFLSVSFSPFSSYFSVCFFCYFFLCSILYFFYFLFLFLLSFFHFIFLLSASAVLSGLEKERIGIHEFFFESMIVSYWFENAPQNFSSDEIIFFHLNYKKANVIWPSRLFATNLSLMESVKVFIDIVLWQTSKYV
jgi:hypothetical protein